MSNTTITESPEFTKAQDDYMKAVEGFLDALVTECRRLSREIAPEVGAIEYDLVPNEDYEVSAELTMAFDHQQHPLAISWEQRDQFIQYVAPYLSWQARLEGADPGTGFGLDIGGS